MRRYHSFFNRSGSSAGFPGLIWAQPWDVHCQEIADVATHERKYESFISLDKSRSSSPPASDPLTVIQALAEASRRITNEASVEGDHSSQAYFDGARKSFQAHNHAYGPRVTDELRHGNMRTTDEAIVNWGHISDPRRTDELALALGLPASHRPTSSSQYIQQETRPPSQAIGMNPRTSTFF